VVEATLAVWQRVTFEACVLLKAIKQPVALRVIEPFERMISQATMRVIVCPRYPVAVRGDFLIRFDGGKDSVRCLKPLVVSDGHTGRQFSGHRVS
jgi:hypothetical protein